MSESLKKYTLFDEDDITLVSEPSNLDEYDDDPGVLRAVLSCGHVTGPETLTDCCRAQLNDGKTEFRCPLCKKTWPYDEVRKLAKLTLEEKQSFEEKLGTSTAKKIVDLRVCPGCSNYVERLDASSVCVECSVCTETNGDSYEFCWDCLREWKGSQNPAGRCGNEGCTFERLLKDCPIIPLIPSKNEVKCPKIRACTSCGTLIEHASAGCNNMVCPKCHYEFCFICLKLGHDFNEDWPCKMAPRQTV